MQKLKVDFIKVEREILIMRVEEGRMKESMGMRYSGIGGITLLFYSTE